MASSSHPQVPLDIIICGGGLAGLAAAGFLRARHNVIVLERSKLDFSRDDYGMGIVSNAMKLLLAQHVDPATLDPVLCTTNWFYTPQNKLVFEQLFDTRERFGSPSVLTTRARLHAALASFATAPEFEGRPAKIVEEAKVARVDPGEGLVVLEDGREFRGDLIIGADGINSTVRTAILVAAGAAQSSNLVKPSGLVSYMSRIPIDAIRSDPALAHLAAPGPDARRGLCFWRASPNTGASCFPIDNETFQVLCSGPEDEWKEVFEREKVGLIHDVDPSHALAVLKDFDPSIRKLFASSVTGKHQVWRMWDIDPLETWSYGRAVLIGDAAHAATPHLGQGCNLAIEDAEALEFLLRSTTKGEPTSLSHALSIFESLRKPRAAFVQHNSRVAGGVLRDEEAIKAGPFNSAEFSKVVYSSGVEDALAAAKATTEAI